MQTLRRKNRSLPLVLDALHYLSHATVQQVYDWLNRPSTLREVSMSSVYRSVHLLQKAGLIKPLYFNENQASYSLRQPGNQQAHFVCTDCNRVRILAFPALSPWESLVSEQLGEAFQVHYSNFNVFGLCDRCNLEKQECDVPLSVQSF
ncbi:Fur family transcriptional regulator [Vampirovibrio sp.]|uniref:Fur family transcriptional regulator n=1 Tax=Vampirovibrio sp. TaxID=2717857 RepID=UPI0035942C47